MGNASSAQPLQPILGHLIDDSEWIEQHYKDLVKNTREVGILLALLKVDWAQNSHVDF
tara:strand:+ start:190 stop:363 length:174 start_codon:yes stop_codon:yes gene_type:complete